MLHQDRARAGSFGEDAARYDRVRPSFPADLVDELLRDGPGPVLDVGCGTGIAGRLFAARGCPVVGVEPDERMAAVARGHGLAVERATFEEWEPAGRRFALVIAAQAWHWVDPMAGALKAGQVLAPGGRVGLFWNQGRHQPEMKAALDRVYRRLAPGLDQYSIVLGNGIDGRLEAASDGLRTSGCFEPPVVAGFEWERSYSGAEWVEQLPTHSDHRTLPPPSLAALLAAVAEVIDGMGGRVEMGYRTWLVSARRRHS